ncbi:MAG: family 16 glycosylhydrolase [Spirochaetales bacterium]|nr:family 16 glycosylhydrolase [Spirochaetales bacterium]
MHILLRKYHNFFFLFVLLIFIGCDSGTTPQQEETLYTLTTDITADSTGIGSIDSFESTPEGNYQEGMEITLKAIATVPGSYFDGWYGEDSGDTIISEDNPYTFTLDKNTSLYARFTRPVIYPAANTDTYNPGTGWTLVWEDNFNDGTFDSDIWTRQAPSQVFNNELQLYTGEPSTAYEQDGYMILKAEHTGSSFGYGDFTSARVISNPGGGSGTTEATGKVFRYGKIAARIQLPSGKGIWPAFWMLGDNISETGGDTPWPSCGEIDILESGSQYAFDGFFGHATVGQAIHYDERVDQSVGSPMWKYTSDSLRNPSGGIYANDFHVFEIEWDSTAITWKVDGITAHSADISTDFMTEFHENFYVIFNIAVGGNYTYAPDESTNFPQYMYIDWIRHYTN